jgi:hypothetical protein
MRTSLHHQSEAQPPNGPLTAATSPDTPSHMPSHAVGSLRRVYPVHGLCESQAGSTTAPLGAGFAGADGDRLALRQKAVRRSHRLRHDNWVILGARCGRNSFSSETTSVLRAVFASRDEPMASAPALPEATVSGQFVQIFCRKEDPLA